jgi:hypothetical protein
MIAETIVNNKINIKDIENLVPERSAKLLFDPKEYLSQSDISWADNRLYAPGDYNKWLTDLYSIKIVLPEKVSGEKVDPSHLEQLSDRILRMRSGDNWATSQILLAKALLAFPDKRDQFPYNERYAKRLAGYTTSRGVYNDLSIFIRDALLTKTLSEVGFKRITIGSNQKSLEKRIHSGYDFRDGFDWALAGATRIVFPEFSHLYTPTDENWSALKDSLEKRKLNKNLPDEYTPVHFRELAGAAILAADDVKLTHNRGVVLINNTNQTLDKPNAVPMRRSF